MRRFCSARAATSPTGSSTASRITATATWPCGFDLTVPFARFAAQNIGKLGTPFKRVPMGPVLRGENTAQAATASSGSATSTPSARPATPPTRRSAGHPRPDACARLPGLPDSRQQSPRAERPAQQFPGPGRSSRPALRAPDKLAKIKREATTGRDVADSGVGTEKADKVLLRWPRRAAATRRSSSPARFRQQRRTPTASPNRPNLSTSPAPAGRRNPRLALDRSDRPRAGLLHRRRSRTFLGHCRHRPGVREADTTLASQFTSSLPGVGASLGLDRLLAAMEDLKLLPKVSTPAAVMIVQFVPDKLGDTND